MAERGPVLGVERASVTIGEATLIDTISLSVADGELVGIIGPNGAGKTTLLRLLSAELAPTSGRCSFDGADLAGYEPAALARHRAVVTQHSQVAFDYRVDEVVALGRLPHGRAPDRPEEARVVREALRSAGVEGLADRSILTLSGGERQRVQFARAVAQLDGAEAPRALLLDEPTSSLDLAHQHEVLRAARGLTRAGVAVVAVLHDLHLAARYTDRVALLAKGRIVAVGRPREVLTSARLSQVYEVCVRVIEDPEGGAPLFVCEARDQPQRLAAAPRFDA